jgi:hypothetical protein
VALIPETRGLSLRRAVAGLEPDPDPAGAHPAP